MNRRKHSIKWRCIGSLTLVMLLIVFGVVSSSNSDKEEKVLASVVGVHHLGEDYLINRFYINKRIGDNVGEEGGGGSRVCCINLPRESRTSLTADVRWKVHHIVRPSDPTIEETEEVDGIYQAKVPIELYSEPGDLYVHFFSGGRVRLVVSPNASGGKRHPVQDDDNRAKEFATTGKPVDAIFNKEDMAELQREIDRDRKIYGDWR